MMAYKFSECGTDKKPDTDITRFIEKVQTGVHLSRAEKDRIAEICYGTSGSGFAGYKLLGWKWDLTEVLNEYIVEFLYSHFQSYHTPDKTSLRKAIAFHGIKRIITVD